MRRRGFPTVLALLCGLAFVMVAGCGQGARDGEGGSFKGNPVILIGVDGATWDVIDPMIRRGELPNFEFLSERGARGPLISLPPLVSPVVWTTFATGVFGRQHGILDHTYPYAVEDAKRPVDSSLRLSPAIWNIATHHGRRVGSVGYHVTHPPERVEGFMVSDRFVQGLEEGVFPRELAGPLLEDLEQIREPAEARRLQDEFFPWDYDPAVLEDEDHPDYWPTRVVEGRVDSQILADEFIRRTTLKLMSRDVDILLTWLRLVDYTSHSAWMYYDASDFAEKPDPAHVEALGDLVPAAYRFIDEFLGEVWERVGSEANIVIISDHGSGSATGPYTPRGDRIDNLTGNHRHDGIFLAVGPDIEPGEYERLTIMEVAPLLLALLDLPVSEALPGRLPLELLRDRYAEDTGLEKVPAYDVKWAVAGGGDEVDPAAEEEAMETLKSLGYLRSSAATAGGDVDRPFDFWSIDAGIRRFELLGELLYQLIRDDVSAALDLMRLIEKHDPDSAVVLPRRVVQSSALVEESLGAPVFPAGVVDEFVSRAGDPETVTSSSR